MGLFAGRMPKADFYQILRIEILFVGQAALCLPQPLNGGQGADRPTFVGFNLIVSLIKNDRNSKFLSFLLYIEYKKYRSARVILMSRGCDYIQLAVILASGRIMTVIATAVINF